MSENYYVHKISNNEYQVLVKNSRKAENISSLPSEKKMGLKEENKNGTVNVKTKEEKKKGHGHGHKKEGERESGVNKTNQHEDHQGQIQIDRKKTAGCCCYIF